MARLHSHDSTMNAGTAMALLETPPSDRERGMATILPTARPGDRAGEGRIASRIGIGAPAETFGPGDDPFARIARRLGEGPCACVFADRTPFLSPAQVWQHARAVDDLGVPVLGYGLGADFRGRLFPGSATRRALADELREVRRICRCGRKATMVARTDGAGRLVTEGARVQTGGNEPRESLCRRHRPAAAGDRAPA